MRPFATHRKPAADVSLTAPVQTLLEIFTVIACPAVGSVGRRLAQQELGLFYDHTT